MKKIITGVVVVILIIVGVSYFGKNSKQAGVNEPIKIGVILPLTGNQAAYGEGIKEGLDLALEEIKSSKTPIKIELVYEDNNGETKNSVSAAQKLITIDKASVLISGVSQHSIAIAPIAQENGVVLLTMASQASALNTAGDYIFKNDDDLKTLGKRVANLVIEMGYNRPAIFFAKYNDAGVDSADAFQKEYETKSGKNVTIIESFGKDESDFRSSLLKIKSSNPDSVFVSGLQKDNGVILKQMSELNMSIKIFGNGSMDDPKLIEVAGAFAEGVIFPTFQGYISASYQEKIRQRTGAEPKRWSVEAYDGLMIVYKALNNISGEISRVSIKNEMSKIKNYQGESGLISFDESGNAQRQLLIKTIKDGQFVKYEQ